MVKNNDSNGTNSEKGLNQSFDTALKLVEKGWKSNDAWDHAEDLCITTGRQNDVAKLYVDALKLKHPKELQDFIAKRAISFYDEWFGSDVDMMSMALSTVIQTTANSNWAFERLTEHLTVFSKWDELFDEYDKAISLQNDTSRRMSLLDEAANIARDIANKPTKALEYLTKLHSMDLGDVQRYTLLERLMTRLDRWEDLIVLWENQISVQTVSEVHETRLQIVDHYLSKLFKPEKALGVLEKLQKESPGNSDGCNRLETILHSEDILEEIRLKSLHLLIANYNSTNHKNDTVNALEYALTFVVNSTQKIFLHQMASSHLESIGKDAEAIAHLHEVLLFHSSDTETFKQLRLLCARSKRVDLLAKALVATAEVCQEKSLATSYLEEASNIYAKELNDIDEAILISKKILTIEDVDTSVVLLPTAYRLSKLLEQTNQQEERLEVLEQIGKLEKVDLARTNVLIDASDLAALLGKNDKALELLIKLLQTNPNDPLVLNRLLQILEKTENWSLFAEILKKRASQSSLPEQVRKDLVKLADVQANKLEDANMAIDTWKQIFSEFGPRADVVDALFTLLSLSSRWDELTVVLKQAVDGQFSEVVQFHLQLGDVYQQEMDMATDAQNSYIKALAMDPANKYACDGLLALVDATNINLHGVTALVNSYRLTQDWPALININDIRILLAQNTAEKVAIYQESAKLLEKHAMDYQGAHKLLVQALPLDPDNLQIAHDFLRLSNINEDWKITIGALSTAAAKTQEGSLAFIFLKTNEAKIRENNLEDLEGALDAYLEVLNVDQSNVSILLAIIRVAPNINKWGEAATAFIQLSALKRVIDKEQLQWFEDFVEGANAWPIFCKEMENALEHNLLINNKLKQFIAYKISGWQKNNCGNTPQALIVAQIAVLADPDNLDGYLLLADLQRENPALDFINTLHTIAKMRPNNLDSLAEAAECAVEYIADKQEIRKCLQLLLEETTKLWKLGIKPTGNKTEEQTIQYATTQLVLLELNSGNWLRATHILVEIASLSFGKEESIVLLKQAAGILVEHHETIESIKIFKQILAFDNNDLETVKNLVSALERENITADLLSAKKEELRLTEDNERCINLRLEIAHLAGILEGSSTRIDLLKNNLKDKPGHDATIDAVYSLYTQRAMFKELTDLFWQQINELSDINEPKRASDICRIIARVAEEKLQDDALAIKAYIKIVQFDCTLFALDSLSRLYTKRGKVKESIKWIEKRLELFGTDERIVTMLRLARAQIQEELLEQAIVVLETAFEESPQNEEVRRLLIEQYRKMNHHESLSNMLVVAAEYAKDSSVSLSYLTEAANLHFEQLMTPSKAIVALRKALEFSIDDSNLKAMLIEALTEARMFTEAKELIEELIEEFGRRRSPKRAALHLQLANVARAENDLTIALEHLELATGMDNRNTLILKTLAELANLNGDLQRAERAYRSLLLIVRREYPNLTNGLQMGPGEILFELSFIAQQTQQTDKASELVESALQAVHQNDQESERVQKMLSAKGEIETLLRFYENRLTYLEKPKIRAKVLSQLADILEGSLGKPMEALDTRLQVLDEDPSSYIYHEAARQSAIDLNAQQSYNEKLNILLEKTRRNGDVFGRCEILLRMAYIAAWEQNDLDKAWSIFEETEKMNVREIDVWRMGAKIAAEKNDKSEQMRLLTNLSRWGESDEEGNSATDANYRLAEIQLSSEENFDEGLKAFSKAFGESPRHQRATRIIQRACDAMPQRNDLLSVYEEVARASDDQEILLDCLKRKSQMENATMEQIREAALLASTLGKIEIAEGLLQRVVDMAEERGEPKENVGWAFYELSKLQFSVSDLPGATNCLTQIVGSVPPESIFSLGKEIADTAATKDKDLVLAARVYKKMLLVAPGSKEAWEPLSTIFLQLGSFDDFKKLIDDTLYVIAEPELRNLLQIRWATLLMTKPEREEEALDVIKNIQLEDPDHEESYDLLSFYLEKNNRFDELFDLMSDRFYRALSNKNEEESLSCALSVGSKLETHDRSRAIHVYRDALSLLANNRQLLQALFNNLNFEDDKMELAGISEKLLQTDSKEQIVSRTLEIAALYKQLNNEEGEVRVLEFAQEHVPEDEEIRAYLKVIYQNNGNFEKIIQLLTFVAESQTVPELKAKTLKEIADLYRNNVSDITKEIDILRQAYDLYPLDVELIILLADALWRSEQKAESVDMLTNAIDVETNDENKYEYLKKRGSFLLQVGDIIGSVKDVEQAFAIDNAAMNETLKMVLKHLINKNIDDDDKEAERKTVQRLLQVLEYNNETNEIRETLIAWLERSPGDIELKVILLKLERATENWADVIELSNDLIEQTDGEEQVAIASILFSAADVSGELEDARKGLETVYEKNPQNVEVRIQLKKVYTAIEEYSGLANLTITDAEHEKIQKKKSALLKDAGNFFMKASDFKSATNVLNQSIELNETDTETVVLLFDILLANNEMDEALALLEKAIANQHGKISKQLSMLQIKRAQVSQSYGDRLDEMVWMEQALNSDPSNGELAAKLADIAEELQEWDVALKALKNGHVLKGETHIVKEDAFYRLGKIYHMLEDVKNSVFFVKKALAENPNHDEAKQFLDIVEES